MTFGTLALLLVCFLTAPVSSFHGVDSGAGVNRGSWKCWGVNILACVLLYAKDSFFRLLGAGVAAGLSHPTQTHLAISDHMPMVPSCAL